MIVVGQGFAVRAVISRCVSHHQYRNILDEVSGKWRVLFLHSAELLPLSLSVIRLRLYNYLEERHDKPFKSVTHAWYYFVTSHVLKISIAVAAISSISIPRNVSFSAQRINKTSLFSFSFSLSLSLERTEKCCFANI